MFICRSHNSQCVQTLSDATDSITSLCVDDVSIVTGYVFCIVGYVDLLMDPSEHMIFELESCTRKRLGVRLMMFPDG